jgi:hypothetical protein
MMWVEILSRHRDVVARFRIDGAEARIGRGYGNDVVVDDPYVAAQHLRVFRDQTGQLVAEDLGSANGVFLDGGTGRLARVVVDGKQPIRIGRTYVRVRDANHAVEHERVMRPERRFLTVALAAALGTGLLGISALSVWLVQTSEPRPSSYLMPLLALVGTILAWVGVWALLSRIFAGRSRFLRNLVIALVGTLAFVLYGEFAQFSAFAWMWPAARDYAYVASWSILAAVCIFHLRVISPSRLLLKGALVATLFAVVIAVQTLQQSEAFSDSGRQNTARRLMPPALRLVPLRSETAFFGDIAKLRTKLDADRARRMAEEAGR